MWAGCSPSDLLGAEALGPAPRTSWRLLRDGSRHCSPMGVLGSGVRKGAQVGAVWVVIHLSAVSKQALQ